MRRVVVGLLLTGCTGAKVSPTVEVRGYDVEPVMSLGLFSDERMKSTQMLVAALEQRGLPMTPARQVAPAWELALEGRNPLTKETCGMPLRREMARRRWGPTFGVVGVITSSVTCGLDGGCTLAVTGAPLDDQGTRVNLEAPIETTAEPLRAVELASAGLASPAAVEVTSTGLGSGAIVTTDLATSPEPPLRTVDLLEVRVWSPDARRPTPLHDVSEKNAFSGLTAPEVVECLSVDQNTIGLLIEVSASGEVARCEGTAMREPCMCDKLKRAAVNSALSGGRWAVSLNVRRKDQLSDDGKLVLHGTWNTRIDTSEEVKGVTRSRARVSDESIEDWNPGPGRLAATCFGSAFKAPGTVVSRWTVHFDAGGTATKVDENLGNPALPPGTADCVKKTLLSARAPCPAKPRTTATADLVIEATEPKAPVPSLGARARR